MPPRDPRHLGVRALEEEIRRIAPDLDPHPFRTMLEHLAMQAGTTREILQSGILAAPYVPLQVSSISSGSAMRSRAIADMFGMVYGRSNEDPAPQHLSRPEDWGPPEQTYAANPQQPSWPEMEQTIDQMSREIAADEDERILRILSSHEGFDPPRANFAQEYMGEFMPREEVGEAVVDPRAGERLQAPNQNGDRIRGQRVRVPEFELASNPTIHLRDVQQRRFPMIDRYDPPSATTNPCGEIPLGPVEPPYTGPRRTAWARIDADEWDF